MTHNFTPIYIPQKTESRDSDTCTRSVHSIIYNSQKVDTTQMSNNRWMHKQDVVYTYNGILFNHKKDEILLHAVTQMNLENILLSEISQTQKDNYCVILLIIWGIWDWTWVSCIAGRFFTIWATREAHGVPRKVNFSDSK